MKLSNKMLQKPDFWQKELVKSLENLGFFLHYITMFEAEANKNRQCNCTSCTGKNGALEYFEP